MKVYCPKRDYASFWALIKMRNRRDNIQITNHIGDEAWWDDFSQLHTDELEALPTSQLKRIQVPLTIEDTNLFQMKEIENAINCTIPAKAAAPDGILGDLL